jgi:hypothetical protein
MSWYYASGGQPQGPVDEAQFEAMVQSGQIKPADLVWREGMANWQPLSTVRPTVAGAADAPPPVTGGAALGPNEIICVECRGIFPRDNAIQYGSTWVCAACKPIFIQKLREGAALGSGMGEVRRFPMGPTPPDQLLASIQARGYDLDLGSCISRGWALFVGNILGSIGVTLILVLCLVGLGVASLIPCIGSLLQLVLQGPIATGFICYFLKLLRENQAGVGDAFAGFSYGWLHLVLYSLVSAIILVLFMVPAAAVAFAIEKRYMSESIPLMVGLVVMGAIPIIILSVSWFFASPLIIDRGLDFWNAMEISRKVVWMHWWQILLLMIVLTVLTVIGILPICVGLLITIPVASATLAYAYEDIFTGPTATA